MSDARSRVVSGDCIESMRAMEPDSVDAVVCDPPYSLSFMGRSWDSHDTPLGFQEWCTAWAREALRVLKPGGHLLAFGGTRTYHRLAAGIEDAGFEIRDTIAWMYGCLTPDVEVLTEDGWKLGIEVQVGERVAQWNPATEAITLAPVERTYRAPYDGPMRVLRNHDTDQILTPNHRVVHEAQRRHMTAGVRRAWWEDKWCVKEASEVPRSGRVRLPLAGYADGPGVVGGEDYAALLGWVWTEGHFDAKGTGVRVYQSPSANPEKTEAIDALMARVAPGHRRYDRTRPYESQRSGVGVVSVSEATWYFSGDVARRVRADMPGKRPAFDLLWRMTLAERRAFLDAALDGDGSTCSRTGSREFSAKYHADLEVFQTALSMTGQRGRLTMRKNRDAGSVSVTPRATTELQTPKLRRPDERYQGDVWCVGVPTGAFVARRAGQVFITGNSGFPKSLDVSKAIDKAAGAEREVVGDKLDRPGYHLSGHDGGEAFGHGLSSSTAETRLASALITAPATPEAEQWDGWGTALKPAYEPVFVARKPLVGTTVAANVLAHGTGALNIDGCRIETTDRWEATGVQSPSSSSLSGGVDGSLNVSLSETHPGGRWPANVMLDEAAGAMLDDQTGDLRAPGNLGGTSGEGLGYHGGTGPGRVMPASRGDSGGASRFFYCSKASSAERRAGLPEGMEASHPTVKPVDVMRWLVKLVTPPDGVVLDPFMGSGSTGIAAALEGFRFIGCEQEAEYIAIAEARMVWWLKHPEGPQLAPKPFVPPPGQDSLFGD